MNDDLKQLFQYLVRSYWAFCLSDWPVVEREKHHRSEVKGIPGIEIVKNYVLEHLGYCIYLYISF